MYFDILFGFYLYEYASSEEGDIYIYIVKNEDKFNQSLQSHLHVMLYFLCHFNVYFSIVHVLLVNMSKLLNKVAMATQGFEPH